jgi:hypothetical protein
MVTSRIWKSSRIKQLYKSRGKAAAITAANKNKGEYNLLELR